MRRRLIKFSTRYHMFLHLSIGLLIFHLINKLTPHVGSLFLACLLGSFLPDLEHVVYYFTHGRNSIYSLTVKGFLRKAQLKNVVKYCTNNHKSLTGLYTHNALTPIFSFVASVILWNNDHATLSAFFLAVSFHFVFDMFEDLLFHGKLNSNWLLKFNR